MRLHFFVLDWVDGFGLFPHSKVYLQCLGDFWNVPACVQFRWWFVQSYCFASVSQVDLLCKTDPVLLVISVAFIIFVVAGCLASDTQDKRFL